MNSEGEIIGAMERLHISRKAAETVEYAGDGVYVWSDGFGICLGTLEGQRIYLEPSVFDAVARIRARFAESAG